MLNDIVQYIIYYNVNGVMVFFLFLYVFDDGILEIIGIKIVNFNIEEVFYVDFNVIGLNNGIFWVNVYNSFQDVLARVSLGDQVWVVAGEYLLIFGIDWEVFFWVVFGVFIYGFFFLGVFVLIVQDIVVYLIIFFGNIGDFVINIDNVYNVVIFGLVSDFIFLKGFYIIGGYVDCLDNFFFGNGVGVFNLNFVMDLIFGVVL